MERKRNKPGIKQDKPIRKKPKNNNNPTGIGGFQKGQSGNPSGRKKDSEEIKAIKDSTRQDLFLAFDLAYKLKWKEKIDESQLTLLQKGMIKTFRVFAATGDFGVIKYALEHIIGKPQEFVKLDAENGGAVQLVIGKDFIPNIGGDNANNKSGKSSKPKS